MRKLIYNGKGVLTEQVSGWLRGLLNEYPYPVEAKRTGIDWEKFISWSQASLPKHTITINSGSSGLDYQTDRVLYGTVGNDGSDTTFMCFKSQKEKDLFVHAFKDAVVNEDPFGCEI